MSRRALLTSAALAGTALGTAGVVSAGQRGAEARGRGADPDGRGGFPPAGITDWGAPVALGNGTARTFTSVTPSGDPKYHGVLFDRAALEGLPSAADLAAAGNQADADKYTAAGQALQIHHMWSLEFFVPFPSTAATPFTFLGLNWNPGGHPPPGTWTVPHFDIHFHMLPMDVVDAIEGPAPPTYDLPARYVPEGHVRPPVVDERVITDMGEHMVDSTAPELGGGTFTNTLIWGAWDADGDGTATLSYVEPMITQASLRNHRGREQSAIGQPATYAASGRYPMAYSVRDVPSRDAVAVTIEDFRFVAGED